MRSHLRPLALVAAAPLALALVVAAAPNAPADAQSSPMPMPMQSSGPMASPTPALSPAPMITPQPMMTSPAPTPSALAAVSPTPIPTPVNPPENALITQRVRATFLAWQHDRVDRKAYTPYAGGTYDPSYVAIVEPILEIGPPQTLTYETASLLLGDVVYRYRITGATGTVSILYSLDPNGRTDGVVFTPEDFRVDSSPAAK
jgi:hypothetical protein